MLSFELTQEEVSLLIQVLDNQLVGMRRELTHTDDRSFRSLLKRDLNRLEVMRARLEKLNPKGPMSRAA